MKTKKKFFYAILALGAVILILIILLNIDEKENPAEFTLSNLPLASFDKDNGFYSIWTLWELPDVDIESAALLEKYRNLAAPQLDNGETVEAWVKNGEYKQKSIQIGKYTDKISASLSFPKNYTEDMVKHVQPQMTEIETMKEGLGFLLHRYEKLLECTKIQDFTSNGPSSLIPHLLTLTRISKYFTILKIKEALGGGLAGGCYRPYPAIKSL